MFPNILSGVVPSVTLAESDDDGSAACRTPTPGRPASRSSSRSAIAPPSASAISTCAARPADVRQPERARRASPSGTNNGCRPNPTYANNSQYSSVGESTYHGLHVSFVAAAGRVGPLPRVVHAVDVDEQRRRVLLQLADRSVRPLEGLGPVRRRPAASAGDVTAPCSTSDGAGARRSGSTDQPRLPGERHAAGVLRAAVQHHLRRHDDSGDRGPADRQWRVHSNGTPASAATSSA